MCSMGSLLQQGTFSAALTLYDISVVFMRVTKDTGTADVSFKLKSSAMPATVTQHLSFSSDAAG